MKSVISYHWRMEFWDRDGEDVFQLEAATLSELLNNIPNPIPGARGPAFCLVRSLSNSVEGVLDQWLTYLGGGVLPDYFAEGIIPVPQFAHGMVAALRDQLAAAGAVPK